MKKLISDPDVMLLAQLSRMLQEEYAEGDEAWIDSPFLWIKTRPSRQVGTIGERLLAGFLAAKGFDVVHAPNSDSDRLVNGKKVEIKFSTLWANGFYKFQQIRDQDYELVICLGISPFDAHAWVIPKVVLINNWGKVPGIQTQHGGRRGSDTAWLTVYPEKVYEWLEPYGGTLEKAVKCFKHLTSD
ncbi:MAG TPA: hypothetical protein VNK96_05210 [Fimbriimonadales bacterium]|nr:hypothetical protein [Fimbriimonadales bacterium]